MIMSKYTFLSYQIALRKAQYPAGVFGRGEDRKELLAGNI